MFTDRNQFEQGLSLAARLPDIMPNQANDRMKALYKDIQQTLHVPLVNLIFRKLANYPDYFEAAWQQIRPALFTEAFYAAADELRGQALLSPAPERLTADAEFGDMHRFRSFNDTIHEVLPKLLLIATALHKLEMAIRPDAAPEGAASRPSEPPQQYAVEGITNVDMVDPENAPAAVTVLFQKIKERHGHPLVSSYYRGLANWPDFLDLAWREVGPRVRSAPYEGCRQRLIEQASVLSDSVFGQGPEPWKGKASEVQEIRMILAAFRLKFIPEMLIDVTLVKALLDGAESATGARFR